jgi:hypothetical protein
MTFDVYGHLFPALDERVTERLDDLHRGASEPGHVEAPRSAVRNHFEDRGA